jgi:PAS domain S-box-containing protein
VHNDVTELNRVIAILRESEDKFSKAFHGLPIAAALVTLEEGRLMDVNDTFCTLFGYNSDEIINHTIKELNLYVNYDERSNHITKLLDEGKIENAEINLRTKSGEIRSCLFWSNSLKIESELYNITGIIDTTDQKWVEKEMARLDRLNMVGQMAASLGHEIRNPMTVVRGFIQLLSEQKCYAKDKNYFELMMEELDRANGILSEYLGMARDKIVELQPQYLDQVVKAIYPMLEADANYREMNIELDLGKPPMPLIDQKEIRQVILNLGRNGLEAMSSGGTLTIGTTVEGNDVVLFVKDEGPGMDPGIMDKLGTPFLTTKLNGSGLGLAVCYSIAARHNARLEFETSPQGTIIKMCFPQQKI